MSLIIFKNNYPTKKNCVVFVNADSFKKYEDMNNAILYFSKNRQICILSMKQDFDELMNGLIELSMFATVIIYTHPQFINKPFIDSIIENYNPMGSIYVGNLNFEHNFEISSNIGLKFSSIIHSGLFEN